MRETFLGRGVPRDKVERLVAKRAQKLLTYRTEMIARTEMVWSAQTSQFEYWQRLMNAGLIPPTSKRIWVVNDDDRLCEQCAPMDGAVVAFHDNFQSSQLGLPGEPLRDRPGGVVESDYPPLHPMCRCFTSLVIE
jgi:hypothetical protein